MAVAFSMIAAYILSRTLVPACSAFWLKGHGSGHGAATVHGDGHGGTRPPATPSPKRSDQRQRSWRRRGRAVRPRRSPAGSDDRRRHRVLRQGPRRRAPAPAPDDRRRLRPAGGDRSLCFWPIMRREFFPEVDAGAFEMYVRAPSGTRIESTEKRIKAGRGLRQEDDRRGRPRSSILSEIGVTSDWSAAYTPNAGPMDAVVKIQLTEQRHHSAQEYVHMLRDRRCTTTREFSDLEFAFDAGGMVRARDERGQVDADQHPGHRQEPEDALTRSPRRSRTRSTRSTASSTPRIIQRLELSRSTSSTSTAPRRPTWA